jgi:hypothetical protein
MTRLVLQPPILVFGGPYSNLRAASAMRARADELGLLRRARGDDARDP